MATLRKSVSSSKKGENVCVAVRVRPLNRLEERTRQKEAWSTKDDRDIFQTWLPEENRFNAAAKNAPAQNKAPNIYSFDYVFGPEKENREIYERICRPVVEACMEGYHGCLFAYGQTSSGKTYTIHGTASSPGMIPQAVESVFQYIEDHPEREFVLRVSYMEIYNEIVNDLLNPANSNLRIREDVKRGVYVEGLKEDIVMSADQIYSLLHAGTSHRHVGRTNYNDVSSRSHTVFRLVIESSNREQRKGGVKVSALNLVDLAGSENAVKAGSEDRIKETGYINKSLLTLGHVIFKLSENNLEHVPYRDSKLTRILQSSLSGKAKVSVCCNISPSSNNIEETISTLKFAARAKKIVNNAAINEKHDDSALLRKYREEIDRLKQELAEARAAAAAKPQPEQKSLSDEDALIIIEQNEQEKLALQAKIEQLTRLILTSSQPAMELPPSSKTLAGVSSPPMPEPQLSNSSSGSNGPPAPLERKSSVRRGPPVFKTRGSSQFGTLPRNFNPPIVRRPSLTNLGQVMADLDEPTGDVESDELLCDAVAVKAFDFAPDPNDTTEALTKKLTKALSELTKTKKELSSYQQHVKVLEKEIEEKDILLQEWDTYYVTNNNKNIALANEVRRVAAMSQENKPELHALFKLFDLEDDFNAPLVDYSDGTMSRSSSTLSQSVSVPNPNAQPALSTAHIHTRQESEKFRGIMSRWKSMEQDMDL